MKIRALCLVALLSGSLTVATRLSAQDQAADLAAANALISTGNYPQAADAFQKFVQDYPTSVVVADAQLKLAYSDMILARFDPAIDLYRKLLVPPAPAEIRETAFGLLPQAQAGKAFTLAESDPARISLFTDAIHTFHDFLSKYPNSDLVETNRYALAQSFYQIGQLDPAVEALRENLAAFPKSESIQDSEYLLALLLGSKANLLLNAQHSATATAFPLYDEATALLGGIIARRADLPLIASAQFQLGEVLFNRALFSVGNDRTRLLQLALAAYRDVDPTDLVIREEQEKISALRARTTATLASKNARAIQSLQTLIGRESSRLAALQGQSSQRIAALLKMARIFYNLSTPALPRYDEARTLLTYLEPLATLDPDKKTILYLKTMTYALQGKREPALAGYEAFQSRYKGDPVAENLPLAIGSLLLGGTPADPTKALELFREQAALYPKSEATAAALPEQARALSQLRRFDEAIRIFQTYLDRKPEKSLAAKAQLGLAEVYRNTARLAAADQIYARIQTEDADDPALVKESSFWRGFLLVQEQKYPEAMKVLAGFVARWPNDPQFTPNALFTYAQAQKGSGATATALQTFRDLVTRFPQSEAATFSYFQRYDMAKEKNDIPAMDAAMHEFIAAYPGDSKIFSAYTNLAQDFLTQNKPQEAIGVYYEFIDRNSTSPLIPSVLLQTSIRWFGLAQALGRYAGLADPDRAFWQKALDHAIADARRVIEKYPAGIEVAGAARSLLNAQKEFVVAGLKKNADIERYFTEFAAQFANAPQTRNKLLFTLASFLYERDPARALAQMDAAYDPALVYAPGDLDLYGSALLSQKKMDAAAAVYQKLADDYPNPAGIDAKQAPLEVQEAQSTSLFGLGQVLLARGDSAGAARNFAHLKELYPWSPKILEANYGIALSLYGQKKYQEAIALVEGIVRAQTVDNALRAKAMILGGKIRRDTGDLAAAIDYFIKTEYFYGGVPDAAAEGLLLGAQSLEAQSAAAKDPKLKTEAAAKAKKYYGDLRQKYPDSPFTAQIRNRG